MSNPTPKTVVLVHGWSVHNTDTYGGLPLRLEREGINVEHVWLGKYVSFRDEVHVDDLARGFEHALRRKLKDLLARGERFACITHSTGGPLVRQWWDEYYHRPGRPCPMSHLVMLAPANFGSALAQLGKSHLSRMSKKLFEGVEPGSGVLDWLELGSPKAWDLNQRWITGYGDPTEGVDPVFPFVLTGQTIDRKLYDHLNSYTAEMGSDGVVRVAAANLNAVYVRLEQPAPGARDASGLAVAECCTAPQTVFGVIRGRSHSGTNKGILRSIPSNPRTRHPTVLAVLRCLRVKTAAQYKSLRKKFEEHNEEVRKAERVEVERRGILPARKHILDSGTMVIVRLRDDQGQAVEDFEFTLTGPRGNPDMLPEGFFLDRQRNSRRHNILTYYLNHHRMMGSGPVHYEDKGRRKKLRDPIQAAPGIGLRVVAKPAEGYVHYTPAQLGASMKNLGRFLGQDETTLLEIVLRRNVREGVFALTKEHGPEEFKNQAKGRVLPPKEM